MFNLINRALAASGDCELRSRLDWGNLSKGIVPPDVGEPGYGCVEFNQLIANIFTLFITIAIPLAVLVILYGGFLLLSSRGSEPQINSGKQAITAAVFGLAIVFGSFIIYNLVIRAISG